MSSILNIDLSSDSDDSDFVPDKGVIELSSDESCSEESENELNKTENKRGKKKPIKELKKNKLDSKCPHNDASSSVKIDDKKRNEDIWNSFKNEVAESTLLKKKEADSTSTSDETKEQPKKRGPTSVFEYSEEPCSLITTGTGNMVFFPQIFSAPRPSNLNSQRERNDGPSSLPENEEASSTTDFSTSPCTSDLDAPRENQVDQNILPEKKETASDKVEDTLNSDVPREKKQGSPNDTEASSSPSLSITDSGLNLSNETTPGPSTPSETVPEPSTSSETTPELSTPSDTNPGLSIPIDTTAGPNNPSDSTSQQDTESVVISSTSAFPQKRRGISSVLDSLQNKKKKLTVLEKSKMDWEDFTEEEGLDEELKYHRNGKNSYIEKQRFLQRSDVREFEIEKSLRQSNRKKQ